MGTARGSSDGSAALTVGALAMLIVAAVAGSMAWTIKAVAATATAIVMDMAKVPPNSSTISLIPLAVSAMTAMTMAKIQEGEALMLR